MNGVLGGFKNMLRQWRINLRKKRKIKIEKENSYKWKSFFYTTLAIVTAPFGYIFSKEKVINKNYNTNIFNQIKKINLQLDEIIVNQKQLDNVISEELLIIEKEINTIKSKPEKEEVRQEFNIINLKKQYIVNRQALSQEKIELVAQKVNENPNLDKKLEIRNNDVKIVSKKKSTLTEPSNPKIYSYKIKEQSNKINLLYPFIAKANKELKKEFESIKTIEEKITKTKQYAHFYELEFELKLLQKKVDLLKQEYDELKKKYKIELNLNFDKYDLAKNDNKIIELLEKIDNDLKIIEQKKQVIFKNRPSKEKTKEEKVQKQTKIKEEKKQNLKQIDERLIAQSIILKDISKQTTYLENYFQKLNKSFNKKKTLSSSLLNFSKTILKCAFSLFPISFFKNKLLGTLVSGIMINNSIKSMRKIANPKLQINYEYFVDQYNDNKDLLKNIDKVYNDSLNELYLLKEELIYLDLLEQNQELNRQIMEIETDLLYKIKQLQSKNQSLDKVYVKMKKLYK